MNLPAEISDELAAAAAYKAFIHEIRFWLPHEASDWTALPMPLKQAWTAAAIAARGTEALSKP